MNKKVEDVCAEFDFYQNLSDSGKEKFKTRLLKFKSSFQFIGKHGQDLTEYIKISVCFAVTQITFGFSKYLIPHFHTVYIYPESYYSKLLENHLKGGTDPKGRVFFSWHDFKQGYEDDNDRINLGLHEFAHALKINLIKGSKFDPKFASYFDRWFEIAEPVYQNMKEGEENGLRSYASANKHEFFAVFLEHFFEHPEKCREDLPDLYNHCCILMNLDPLNKYNDYRIADDFIDNVNRQTNLIPLPDKIKRTYQYDSWHWSSSLMTLGLIAGVALLAYFLPITAITNSRILLIALAIWILGQSQWPYFKNAKILKLPFFLLYTLLGNAVFFSGIFLLLNFLGAGETYTENYNIEKIHVIQREIEGERALYKSRIHINDDKYQTMPKILTCYLEKSDIKKGIPSALELELRDGIFGYPIVCDHRIIYN